MAISAFHRYRSVRRLQTCLQVYLMVQLHGTGIGEARLRGAELGMDTVKAQNARIEVMHAVRGLKTGVALRAAGVGNTLKPRALLMLTVASRARRGEYLVHLVHRPVVAGAAVIVADRFAEAAAVSGSVAKFAARAEYSMCRRHRSRAVYGIAASERQPAQPEQRGRRGGDRQTDTPAPERVLALKV